MHEDESIAVEQGSGNFSEYAVTKGLSTLPKSQLSVLAQVVALLKTGVVHRSGCCDLSVQDCCVMQMQ